jgi:protease-4
MWVHVWRAAALTYWMLSEAVLRLFGRRPAYGVLTLEIAGDLPEAPAPPRLLGLLHRDRYDFFNLLALLRWAREDAQLRGVLIRCGNLRIGWAKVQEIFDAISALRAAGKTVWVHMVHADIQQYVLASAADQVLLAPAGTLDIAGLSSEVTFIAGTLQKLGIEAELIQMGKYKSAAEMLTRSDMSEPHREMLESLVHDLYAQIVDRIAAGRRMDAAHVCGLLDRGPFVAPEAQQERLVDGLLYEDEAEERLRARCDDAGVIEQHDYFVRRGRFVRRQALRRNRACIGVLHVTATLKMGESIAGPESAGATGVVSVCRDLKDLRERNDIGAVVLRISSPGGSGLASDLMWHEVMRTRACKPVVVSFGDVAASGGYYVGIAGAPLVAQAGTITGSIGVLAGKALLRGFYDRIGVTKELVTRGRHAALYSDYVPLGDEERMRLQTEAEFFYEDFIAKVAARRQLSPEAVAAVAQGRVWTGRQAHARGLVDQLGGIERALSEAKVLMGLAPDLLVAIERYPKPRRLWKLSFSLRPTRARTEIVPWPWFLLGERVWAVLPFNFRFF